VYMRGRENHRADTLSMPDDPFDDSWGWGEAAAIKIFVFLRLPTSWNRLFAPRFPLCRSIEFCQPTLPSPRVRPLPPQVQPFGLRPRGLMKLDLPSPKAPGSAGPKDTTLSKTITSSPQGQGLRLQSGVPAIGKKPGDGVTAQPDVASLYFVSPRL